ncbi:MAG: DUF2085 domain-containing protein, partial [Thermomicrobiales bacterium]|nr:DUF2085 domain-containing protein [Thermomicrobiales bacterium]
DTLAPWRVLLALAAAVAAVLLAPGELRHTVHLLLQGVCAQRPSHSLWLAGQPLPVDARMTGTYLGAASALLWYLLLGRGQHAGRFTRGMWALLGIMVSIMALDGLNSLASDLDLPLAYTPSNGLRLVTGLLAGVAIGALLSHLAVLTMARRPRGGWSASSSAMLLPPLLTGAAWCGVATSGLPTLALPVTWLTLGASVAVLWAMISVLTAIGLGRCWGFSTARQRDETLALAFVVACLVLAALAGGRALLEQVTGPVVLS